MPPLIELGSLGDNRSTLDLDDPRLYDGILLRRTFAAFLDFVIVTVIASLLWLVNCAATLGTLGLLSLPAFVLAPVVIHLAMSTFLVGGSRSATYGMRACGVRLIGRNGGRVDHVQAFLTTAMFFASVSIFFPILLVGFFTPRSRLVHDIVVGTLAIRDEVK
ncbi:RDD family protein [Dongia sp.]|uniref:RDD family protein n=1 Tax=Dongia sp. TaxID=1977262 RepID=UPI0035B2144B